MLFVCLIVALIVAIVAWCAIDAPNARVAVAGAPAQGNVAMTERELKVVTDMVLLFGAKMEHVVAEQRRVKDQLAAIQSELSTAVARIDAQGVVTK